MSAPATLPPPQTQCPHCGADLAPDQDWCLECGREVGPGPAPAPPSRWSRLAAGGVAAGLCVAALVVLLQPGPLSRDEPPSAPRTNPPPTSAQRPPATPPPAATRPRSAPQPPAPAQADGLPVWPPTEQGYTVVMLSTTDRSEAGARARVMVRSGADAGIFDADEYVGFPTGSWVVWRGRYQELSKAEEALAKVRRSGRSGEIRYVRRRS